MSLGQQLSDQLRRRGYNTQATIATATSKANSQRKEDLLRYNLKPELSSSLISFVLTYHPELSKVKEIDKHWPITESSKRLNKTFPQKPIMAYRRPKRVRDILIHAKLNPDSSADGTTGESKPCGSKRCFTFKRVTPTQIANLVILRTVSETREADKLQMPVTLNALYPGVLPRRHALSSRWMRAVDHHTCENRLEEVQEADTSSLFPLSLFQDMWPCVQLVCA